jgi:hypothetical protein
MDAIKIILSHLFTKDIPIKLHFVYHKITEKVGIYI